MDTEFLKQQSKTAGGGARATWNRLRYPSDMHSHAGHGHSHGTGRVLRFSLGVTLLYVGLLVVAGIRAHSLALLSEAGHNLSDFLALLLSLVAVFLE
ncbi:MAG: hypothetical protein WCB11_15475, partial [Terriglobales bacterium]